MADFIAKKREIFLVQMSLDTKRAEIKKLEDRARQREEALQKSEQVRCAVAQAGADCQAGARLGLFVAAHEAGNDCRMVRCALTQGLISLMLAQLAARQSCACWLGLYWLTSACCPTQMLEEDTLRFDAFLKENDEKVQEAIKRADAESRAKNDKVRGQQAAAGGRLLVLVLCGCCISMLLVGKVAC